MVTQPVTSNDFLGEALRLLRNGLIAIVVVVASGIGLILWNQHENEGFAHCSANDSYIVGTDLAHLATASPHSHFNPKDYPLPTKC